MLLSHVEPMAKSQILSIVLESLRAVVSPNVLSYLAGYYSDIIYYTLFCYLLYHAGLRHILSHDQDGTNRKDLMIVRGGLEPICCRVSCCRLVKRRIYGPE